MMNGGGGGGKPACALQPARQGETGGAEMWKATLRQRLKKVRPKSQTRRTCFEAASRLKTQSGGGGDGDAGRGQENWKGCSRAMWACAGLPRSGKPRKKENAEATSKPGR